MTRLSAPELDAIIGREFPVLDHGFVRVVDYMGSDAAVVQAARVSYGHGTKKVHEDRGLIRYLMRHNHTTPFEMCEIKLHVRVPMDTWRQWIRHRTASVNEYSTRYSIAIDAAQTTPPDGWRLQASDNKQGSGRNIDTELGATLSAQEQQLLSDARKVYENRLALGIAREQARKDLPLSTYTEAYWKIDLHNLLHFLRLRLDPHAQRELRGYASLIDEEILGRWCPIVREAFHDYQISGTAFTGLELEILQAFRVSAAHGQSVATSKGLLAPDGARSTQNRELVEFEAKLNAIGLPAPWADR